MAVRKKGQLWVADFYLGGRDGRRVRRSAPTRQLAEALERDAKLRELRSELGAEEIKKNTLREFIQLYTKLYSPSKTPRTRKWDSFTFSRIREHFGNPSIARINRQDIEGYKALRCRSVSKSTANRELDLLKSLLNRAVEWGYLKTSPAIDVKRYKLDEKFSDDEQLEVTQYGQVLKKGAGNAKIYINGLRVAEEENFLFSYAFTPANRAVFRFNVGQGDVSYHPLVVGFRVYSSG